MHQSLISPLLSIDCLVFRVLWVLQAALASFIVVVEYL